MNVYLITYHLDHHQHDENDNLSRKIKSLGSWGHVMPSAWIVTTSMTSEEIKSSIETVIEANTLFFISKITPDHAGFLHKGALPWISECVNKDSESSDS
ncbi:hypothetical protein [Clostridium uliginosum]|uniref:CRISPR-associated protein Cas2 n=1 Tax=Clostridium uliginosum TaxID=119641 RepID=A0A1I1MYI6_9CLOT|nr:hypothetical protein [Clostridium uliginosum]SFC87623.1 hypothetical protein SAMN05421842_1121 [Clostridium uliginosum]